MFIGLCGAQPCLVFLNAAGRKMIGLSSTADIATYRITEFFTPQDRQVLEEIGLPTMLRERQWEKDLYFHHLIDSTRQAEIRWSSFAPRDATGAVDPEIANRYAMRRAG